MGGPLRKGIKRLRKKNDDENLYKCSPCRLAERKCGNSIKTNHMTPFSHLTHTAPTLTGPPIVISPLFNQAQNCQKMFPPEFPFLPSSFQFLFTFAISSQVPSFISPTTHLNRIISSLVEQLIKYLFQYF